VEKTVAVVIAFFNGADWVERALKSVVSQTRPADEIIIVDDGSRDDQHSALLEITKAFPVRVLRKSNGGQGSARNFGVLEATSDYICFLDQDDFFLEWHHEHLLSLIPTSGYEVSRFAFAYCDAWRTDSAGDVIQHGVVKSYGSHPKTSLHEMLKRDCFILPSASIICRNAFLEVGGFDERLTGYEDDDLFSRMFAAGFTHVFDERPVLAWTVNESSTSFSDLFARSRYVYFEKLLKTYANRERINSFMLRDVLAPRFMGQFVDSYLRSCFLEDGNVDKNRERLGSFLAAIEADLSCKDLGRQKRLIRAMVKVSPRTIVSLGTLVSTRIGSKMLGRLGEKARPRLRELALLRRLKKG
jgi:glycosyltransferase involved in cell wall biosynthesis